MSATIGQKTTEEFDATEARLATLSETLIGALPSLCDQPWPKCPPECRENIRKAWTKDGARQAASVLASKCPSFAVGVRLECVLASADFEGRAVFIALESREERDEYKFMWELTVDSKTGETVQANWQDLTYT